MKRSLQTLAVAALALIAASCTREIAPSNTIANLSTDVLVKDQNGNNLLSSSSVAVYNFNDIHLYTIDNGSRTELINSVAATYFKITKGQDGQSVLTIEPRMTSKNQRSVTATIQWRKGDEDVIEYAITTENGSSKCDHTKCNGQPSSPAPKATSTGSTERRVIQIVKQ